jgi:hypothetical protein
LYKTLDPVEKPVTMAGILSNGNSDERSKTIQMPVGAKRSPDGRLYCIE